MATLNESRGIVANYDAKVAEARAGANPDDAASLKKASDTIATLTAEYNAAKDHLAMAEQFASTGQPTPGSTAISSGMTENVTKDPKGGYTNLADFVNDVMAGGVSPRIRPHASTNGFRLPRQFAKGIAAAQRGQSIMADGQVGTIGSDGGFMIPPEYRPNFDLRQPTARLNQFVTREPIRSNTFIMPQPKDNTNASGAVANVTVGFTGEQTANSVSTAKFEELSVPVHTYVGLVKMSWITDTAQPAMSPNLFRYFGEALANTLDNKILNGTGSGQPLGLLVAATAANKGSVTRASAGLIKIADIAGMINKISDLNNSVWYACNSVKGELLQLVIGSSLAGYVPQGALPNSVPFDTLLGRPIIYGDFGAALGTVGDLVLINTSKYIMPVLGTTEYAESLEFSFDTGQRFLRIIGACGGSPRYITPFTAANAEVRYDTVVIAT